MFWFLFTASLASFVYFFLIKPFSYWKNLGVPQQNLWDLWVENLRSFFQTKSSAESIRIIYDNFPDKRYFGMYQLFTPVLMIRDPDLVKQITVKDFDHFIDHNLFTPEETEPLWGKNLFALKGERWKDMRATLSPSFTSSKMRNIFNLMTECADQFVDYFERKNEDIMKVEMKDAFTRYANDIIFSAAFGITCDSLKEPKNEFYLMGKAATNLGGFWKGIAFLMMYIAPKLANLLDMHIFSNEVSAFFRKLVKDNIECREKNGIVRHDMIHLLMEARKGRLKHDDSASSVLDSGFAVIEESSVGKEEKRQKRKLSDDDLTAQALIFFFAGFESVSTFICFTAHELAINPEVQLGLQDEIDKTLRECGGTLTYEALLKMTYLDMVISEALRKWPRAVVIDRVCVKPYTIQPAAMEEKPIHVKMGEILWIPIFGIHRDSQFYPKPDCFDPERFNEESKSDIYPYSYLPFGAGPRSCIGNRFALLETKTLLFHVLAKFEIVVVDKTTIPVKLARDEFTLNSEDGFWLGLKIRRKTP